jgi:hypothetical protein
VQTAIIVLYWLIFQCNSTHRKQSDVLIDIAKIHDLFHDASGTSYARVEAVVYPVESNSYREVLAERYLDATGKGCNRNSLGDAVTTISSLAKFKNSCRDVWLRVAENTEGIVIDTGRDDHKLIQVTPGGWHWFTGERPLHRGCRLR